jgi:hypothetical protein
MPSEHYEDPIPPSTNELALSMMRLWGKDARTMARTYAFDCWRKGDARAYMRWHSVEWAIEQAQAPQAYEGTVSGVQPQQARPRRWFDAVIPAIRQLGNSAIRGTGL